MDHPWLVRSRWLWLEVVLEIINYMGGIPSGAFVILLELLDI